VRPRLNASYGKLPARFEANRGQSDERVRFLSRGAGYELFLTSTELVLVLGKPAAGRPAEGEVLRTKFLGADPRPSMEGREELPGRSHYLIGNDPTRWHADVPQYSQVDYREVWPGIGLTYHGHEGQLEYDFVVSPGGDPRRIRLGIEGALEIRVDAEGNLIERLRAGEVVQKAPVVYQDVDGARKAVAGRFVLKGRAEVGFEVGPYAKDRPLVLDPVLLYSTYLGGDGSDQGYAIAVDSAGSAYVTGLTLSSNFPTAHPVQAAYVDFYDVFVAKLNPSGSALVYSTYLGGSGDEIGYGIAVDSTGNAYVTGYTGSADFPTANPLQAANGGLEDAFVTKLDPTGSTLVYSTYLGGTNYDSGFGIAADTSGNAYVAGSTRSTDFPTAHALQAASGGSTDGFVAKLSPSGSALVYSTYLGGTLSDQAIGIAVDPSGSAYVTGVTQSNDFPTVSPLQAASGGSSDAFVAKLNPAGSALVYSTHLGGSDFDSGYAIAVDATTAAYVTGSTSSTDFPTVNPLQGRNGGNGDAFVAKVNAAGTALVYSTYLGGSRYEFGHGVAVDAFGNAHVSGVTASNDFPTANPLQATNGGDHNAFVAKLTPAGSAFVYSTYLGGVADQAQGIALDASANVYLTGITDSVNFPTANPLQPASGGGGDAFVAKIGIGNGANVSFFPVAPCRVVDTRGGAPIPGPALQAQQTRVLALVGICGIPSSALAVSLNVTVTQSTAAGNVRLFPSGQGVPSASTINYGAGQTRANNGIVALDGRGQLAAFAGQTAGTTVDLILDVNGYFQ
jgi:hypothetical protein